MTRIYSPAPRTESIPTPIAGVEVVLTPQYGDIRLASTTIDGISDYSYIARAVPRRLCEANVLVRKKKRG